VPQRQSEIQNWTRGDIFWMFGFWVWPNLYQHCVLPGSAGRRSMIGAKR
jgi:hypothetical protein